MAMQRRLWSGDQSRRTYPHLRAVAYWVMTKLLEQAVGQLRDLPEELQDRAAKTLIQYVDEMSANGREDRESERLQAW